MAEASEAPVDPDVAVAQAMLAELTAGDREVSQSEPKGPPEPTDVRDDGQPDEAEASSDDPEKAEAPPTPDEDGDAPDDSADALDLEWIDTQDSAYADFLTNLHKEGKLDPDTFKAVKQAYQPRRGMNAAQQRAAQAEADAKKWQETGKPLFDSDDARRDYLTWREQQGKQAEQAEDPKDAITEAIKSALREGDDDDIAAAVLMAAEKIAESKITGTRAQDEQAAAVVQEFNENLNSWGANVKQHFIDIEDATAEDVAAAAQVLEATLDRRRVNAMDVIRSEDDLRDEMAPFVEKVVLKRKLDAVLGRQSERSKQYNGNSLKASSSPGVPIKTEEDLSTTAGRLRALENDPDIKALWEARGGI